MDIPFFPVFSPHDTERLKVFDKFSVEKHMDIMEEKINKAIFQDLRKSISMI